MPKARLSAIAPAISGGSSAETAWLPAPSDFTPAQVAHFRELAELVETQTGLQATDATVLAQAVRSACEERVAVRFMQQAAEEDDFKTWQAAQRSANTARATHRAALAMLRISPDTRSGRVAKVVAGRKAVDQSDRWTALGAKPDAD